MTDPDFVPFMGSLDLEQLVQDHLQRVHQRFPASRPRTLDDFREVIDELSDLYLPNILFSSVHINRSV
jgi:hypothetical protein